MPADTPDPMTVVKIRKPGDPPGVALFGICRRSTAARLAADAEPGGEVSDLGAALALVRVYERKRNALGASLMRVGVAQDGDDRWLAWFLPSYPAEKVPGSRGHIAGMN